MKEFDVPEGTLPGPRNLPRHIQRSSKILRRITNTVNKSPHEIDLLDVGCSSGAFLLVARDQGFKVAGVEPAPAAVKTARGMGLIIYEGRIESLDLAGESYDVVTMFEVMEHVRDPITVLKECHRILRPRGIVVICTGNAESWTVKRMGEKWEYFDMEKHGGHISFFNPTSMRILAERTGFGIADLKTRNVRLNDRTHVGAFRYRAAKIAGEALSGFARLFSRGHDMLVIMRKTVDGGIT
jgi:SAM-dependent methyltransferase